MADGATGWTVLLRDGVPAAWMPAAQVITRALASTRFTPGDVNRALRMGQGFVDLPMSTDEAERVAAALVDTGTDARALRWAECEPAEVPLRVTRVDFDGAEVVPGLRWDAVHVVHVVRAEPAPFFLPPDVSEATRSAGRIAFGVSVGAAALGLDGVDDVAGAVSGATDVLTRPISPARGAPELCVEVLGLWAPRVHLVVDSFQHDTVPGPPVTGGRALARLLSAVLQRTPSARRAGWVDQALARAHLTGLRALPAGEHKRLVSAWLTARRLWPSP